MLTHQLATLDRLSEGRLIAGMGGGFPNPATEAQFAAVAIGFARRIGRMEESIDVMRRLWSGQTVSHTGEHFTFTDVRIEPSPHRPGGPPRPVTPALYATLCLDEDPEKARQRLRKSIERYYNAPLEFVASIQAMFAGTPRQAADWLTRYAVAGARHLRPHRGRRGTRSGGPGAGPMGPEVGDGRTTRDRDVPPRLGGAGPSGLLRRRGRRRAPRDVRVPHRRRGLPHRIGDGTIEALHGPAQHPDATITLSEETFLGLTSQRLTLTEAVDSGAASTSGDSEALSRLNGLFRLPPPRSRPVARAITMRSEAGSTADRRA
ncbi:LLM class flavin-dependent oxidoreductase [Nonomuraea sp. 10N515B]|uniref:LLM class flavin-dependent oxidoreductase n=1 Tax=Nonomuraea sp. 10N515B TaxID=3457422 RepID=UPI003FCD717C